RSSANATGYRTHRWKTYSSRSPAATSARTYRETRNKRHKGVDMGKVEGVERGTLPSTPELGGHMAQARSIGGARGFGALATTLKEARASYAFVERNWNLTKRYWGWEVAFLIYSAAASMSIMFIGKAQGEQATDLLLFLAIGTLVW